jgi:hypothetical protein
MTPKPLSNLLVLAAPPAVWAVHFAILYASNSFFCGYGRVLPAAATIFAALAIAAFVAFFYRRTAALFERAVGLMQCLLAAVAVTWNAIPLLLLRPCVA